MGRAIKSPPSATCWQTLCRIPNLKSGSENSVGSNNVGLPSRWGRTSQRTSASENNVPANRSGATDPPAPPPARTAPPLPGPHAQPEQRHAQDRQDRPDDVDAAVTVVGDIADQTGAEQHA